MPTVRITDAPLTIEDLLVVPNGAQVELAEGYAPRSQAAGRGGPGLAAGNAVHGLTAQVGHGKHARPEPDPLAWPRPV